MLKRFKKYLPIRIHHIKYSYGWWFGDAFFFFEKHWCPIKIVPMCLEFHNAVFAKTGKTIIANSMFSWNNYKI